MSITKRGLDQIAAAAEAAAAPVDPEVRIAFIEARLAEIEPLLEQAQANSALSTSLTNYVSDLRDEQKFFNRARYAVGCSGLLVIVAMAFLLGLAIFHPQSPLFKSSPHVVAAFVVSLLSGMVFILSAFAKGVFRSTVERHADGFLPPALERAAELADKVLGRN